MSHASTPRPAGPPALERFYHPRSIAVVGATTNRPSLANLTKQVLTRAEAAGAAFIPINPKADDVFGYPAVASIRDVDQPVDVLIILTNDPTAIVAEAEGKDVGFVLVFANGFAELGTAEGIAREEALANAVRGLGARLIGPNTNANSLRVLEDNPGRKIAMVFQSGHQGAPIAQSQELGVSLSYWAPTGNEADLEVADFIEYFARDPETAAICGYIEGFKSGSRLRDAAITAIEEDTPLVLVKVGRSDAGTAMAMSHTGHLAGADAVYDAFFEQYGVNRVDDLDELLEVSVALARAPIPEADGLAVVSVSGGTAAHLADLVVASGLSLPELGSDAQSLLREVIPAEFRIVNPVDTGGPSMGEGRGVRMIDAVLSDPGVGVLMFPITGVAPMLTELVAESLLEAKQRSTKPILVIWSGPTADHPAYRQLWDAGFPVFRNFRNAIRAAKALFNHPARRSSLHDHAKVARALVIPELPTGEEVLAEAAATAWLEARGIPFAPRREAGTVDQAVAAADDLGYPVVLKGTGVAHKSEQGLVVLDLRTSDEVRRAATDLLTKSDGLLVAKQITGGVELLVGIVRDPELGPVILVGSGGTSAEAINDVSRSVLPLTRERAEEMLDRLRLAPLLGPWRGRPAVDRDALVDVLLTLADLAVSEPIIELDVNPVLARADGIFGLDALVRLAT